MADAIEPAVTAFAKDLTALCAALRLKRIEADKGAAGKAGDKPAGAKPAGDGAAGEPPVIAFALDKGSATKVRTPEEQAAQVAAGRSWVCWGAHMADAARHVVMKVDGKIEWDPKKAFGADWSAFQTLWAATMKKHKLKNARGGDGWFSGDGFHLELADSKMAKTDPRCKACLEEYARLTRTGKNKPNAKFEKAYPALLAPYVAKYEKKAGQQGSGAQKTAAGKSAAKATAR